MADEKPEDVGPAADPGRAKREPPTIDLEAIEITDETPNPDVGRKGYVIGAAAFGGEGFRCDHCGNFRRQRGRAGDRRRLVRGLARRAGSAGRAGRAAGQFRCDRRSRRTRCRRGDQNQRARAPVAPASDPAAAARADALEKSLAALRSEIAGQRAQSEKLAAAVNEVKSAPRETVAPPVDLSAINDRLAQIERAARAQTAAIAQQETSKPADDVPLRRIVAAALLDVLVRTGDPYSAALAAAKALAGNPDALKPLDGFAASGVPSNAALSRDLLTLVPKLSPPAQDNATTGAGLVDRLQAGAAKLVRIERTDAVGTDRGAVVGRVTAAALHNDVADARRELNTLAPADRAAAQAWLDKCDARDAALATSRQFAAEAMAALAKPAQ